MSRGELRIADCGLQRAGSSLTPAGLSLSPRLLVSLSLAFLLLIAVRAALAQYPTCPDGLCPVQRGTSSSQLSTLNSQLSAAACRITVGDGSAGSGTLVARNVTTGLVLTCSHLFDDSSSDVVVSFPSGRRYGARIIDRDRANDLAALLIRRPDVKPVEVSDQQPTGPLAACGYGPDGQFRCVRGNVVGQAMPVGATYPSVVLSGAVRPGDSGGGVLDAEGRLVGVVWGQRSGQTYLTCGQPLRQFLRRIMGSREPRVESQEPASQPTALPWDSATGNASTGASPPAEPGADGEESAGRLGMFASQLSALRSDIASLRAGKQDRGQYLTAGALASYARRDDVDSGLAALAGRFASVQDRLATVRQQVDAVAAGRAGLLQGLSMGKLVAGALGLSGPLAAAVIVAGGLVGRRLKSRHPLAPPGDLTASKSFSGANPPAEPGADAPYGSRPVAVDSPPLPQRAVPETHYVPYEKDTFAKAYQWASEQVVRKYPGTLDVLSSLDSLIKQQLNAQPTDERAST